MTGISRIYSEKPVSEEVNRRVNEFDITVSKAIEDLKEGSVVPQGLVVAMLHTYAHEQTARLLAMKIEAE